MRNVPSSQWQAICYSCIHGNVIFSSIVELSPKNIVYSETRYIFTSSCFLRMNFTFIQSGWVDRKHRCEGCKCFASQGRMCDTSNMKEIFLDTVHFLSLNLFSLAECQRDHPKKSIARILDDECSLISFLFSICLLESECYHWQSMCSKSMQNT